MWRKKIRSIKKLANKANVAAAIDRQTSKNYENLRRKNDQEAGDGHSYISTATPNGFVAVYVGEERQRFVVPTGYLSHPLFKMLLEKASDQFGFDQQSGLAVPCSVTAFQEVVSAIECCHGNFDFGDFVEEFL